MPVCPILRSIPKILEFDEEKAGGTGVAVFKHASASAMAMDWLEPITSWHLWGVQRIIVP